MSLSHALLSLTLCCLWCITSFPSQNLTLSNFNETSSFQRQINPFMDENIPTLTSEQYSMFDWMCSLLHPLQLSMLNYMSRKYCLIIGSFNVFNDFLKCVSSINSNLIEYKFIQIQKHTFFFRVGIWMALTAPHRMLDSKASFLCVFFSGIFFFET